MFHYDATKMQALLEAIILANCSTEGGNWLQERIKHPTDPAYFNTTFAQLPRKTGRAIVQPGPEQQAALQQIYPGFAINGWTIDRLARVWLLTQLAPADKETYFNSIENLFRSAAVNELVALYSALPLLAYPELWKKRCAEGIRSNIGDVLESIMYHNPYPAAQLDQPAWNQLVLKAIFTGKQIQWITGLDERANQELAYILSDYAHERWAAHRNVPAQLWRLSAKFIDEKLFPDIKKAMTEGDEETQRVIALAIAQSEHPPATALLAGYPALKQAVAGNKLSWEKDIGIAS